MRLHKHTCSHSRCQPEPHLPAIAQLCFFIAMAATLDDIMAQLSAARKMIADGQMLPDTQKAFALNIATQVAMMTELDLPGASRISNALTDIGFGDADRGIVQNAALQLAMQVSAGTRRESTQTQTLKNPLVYFTASDYVKLKTTPAPSQAEAVMVVADRCKQLQLFAPSEDTVRGLAALAGAHVWRERLPTPVESLALFQSVKTQLRAMRRDAPPNPTPLWVYPAEPKSLPAPLWRQAYAPEDPPVAKVCARFHLVRAATVCRTSHKGVTPVAGRQAANNPAAASNPAANDLLSMLVNMLHGAAGPRGSAASGAPDINLSLLGPPRPRGAPTSAAALADGDSQGQSDDTPPHGPGQRADDTPPSQGVLALAAPGVMPPPPAAAAPAWRDASALLQQMERAAAKAPAKAAKAGGAPTAAAGAANADGAPAAAAAAKAGGVLKRPAAAKAAAAKAPAAAGPAGPPPRRAFPAEAVAAYEEACNAAWVKAEADHLAHKKVLARAQVAGQKARKRKMEELSI